MSGPSDGYTQVDFAAMQQAEADFADAYRSLRSELDDLEGQLKTLLAPWVGKANSAYEVEHTNWTNASSDMAATLQGFGFAIRDIHGNYSDAEMKNFRLWDG